MQNLQVAVAGGERSFAAVALGFINTRYSGNIC